MGWAKKILTLISTLNITKLVIKIKWAFPETVRTLIYPSVEDFHFQKLYRFWNSIKTFTTNPGIFQYFFSFFHSWNFLFLPPTEIFRNQTSLEFRRPQQGDTDFLWQQCEELNELGNKSC